MKHIVSFSAGKDSTAMLIRMFELGYKVDEIVFADTLFEFPELYSYIEKIEQYIGRKIIRLTSTMEEFEKWINGEITRGSSKGEKRGLPLTYFPCWWSREAKFKKLDRYIGDNFRYIGIAHDEQKRIRNHKNYIYPLNEWGWSEKMCLDYLKSKGLYNNLYDKFDRLGCYWCIKQSEKSLLSLKKYYPDLFKKTLELVVMHSKNGPFLEKVLKVKNNL